MAVFITQKYNRGYTLVNKPLARLLVGISSFRKNFLQKTKNNLSL